MAKVFTITEGLENLGALRSGGQGSVYKARRTGEILSAVKLLPTPVVDPANDQHYRDFQNEVVKLQKVNEDPHPNVVQVYSWGITETGGFPYIEMEFIDGPDLAELLRPPHGPVFTIKEAVRVAEHLSAALAHCHRLDVKHGDIKSNNVKYNRRTGNYVLLDFGLALLSDEQRRTSLRHAGAIEFMAPEQNEGRMLFQTDVYSFGVVLYELLAGRVPYPLNDNSETARNSVMLAHMDQPVPDLAQLRQDRLPADWSEEKRSAELALPVWLTDLIYRCLQKLPEQRFANGAELHEYILLNEALGMKKAEIAVSGSDAVTEDNVQLLRERDALQLRLMQYQREAEAKDREVFELNAALRRHEDARITATSRATRRKGVSQGAFLSLLFLTLLLGGLAAWALMRRDPGGTLAQNTASDTTGTTDTGFRQSESSNAARSGEGLPGRVRSDSPQVPSPAPVTEPQTVPPVTKREEPPRREATKPEPPAPNAGAAPNTPAEDRPELKARYKVRSKAHFYNQPDEATRRNAFIVHWNNAVLRPRDERNGFVYIVFTNDEGQTSKGWMRKSDLIPVRD